VGRRSENGRLPLLFVRPYNINSPKILSLIAQNPALIFAYKNRGEFRTCKDHALGA
jgi:hypothetical protein